MTDQIIVVFFLLFVVLLVVQQRCCEVQEELWMEHECASVMPL